MSLNIHDSKFFVWYNHSQTFFIGNKDRPVKTMCLKKLCRQICAIFKLQNNIILPKQKDRIWLMST